MRKILVAGILALVVIGCVLAAGCTTSTTSSTTTTDSVVGTWTLPNGTTVVFNNDFTGVMTQGENKIKFAWKKTTDGKYQVNNEKGDEVLWTPNKDGTMTNAASMVLTKKSSSTSGYIYEGDGVFQNDEPVDFDIFTAPVEINVPRATNQASGTMSDVELTDVATDDFPYIIIPGKTLSSQVTFTIVQSNGGTGRDDMVYTNATITADVGTPFKITEVSPNGGKLYRCSEEYLTFNYIENGQEKSVVLNGTTPCDRADELRKSKYNISTEEYSKAMMEIESYLYNSVEQYINDGLYCGGDGIIITQDMDGKTYYI